MTRILSSVLVLLIVIFGPLALARGSATAGQDDAPKILRIWWSGEFIDDLEPQTNENGISDLTRLNYEGLTRFDEELKVVPGAAESWEFSADGLAITFHLRDNLTYSDGSPLTAERFRYAIERRCGPHLASSGAEDMFDIAGCEELKTSPVDGPVYDAAKANLGVRALDDRTLEIDLRQPAPYFPALTEWIGFIPVKQELIEAGSAPELWLDPANWVGNGPFQVTAIEQDHISLVRNERYWGGQAKLDGIEYAIMNIDAALEAYKRGELDVTFPQFDALPSLEADPVLSREVYKMASPDVGLFKVNHQLEPFSDKKVREAFAYAFDRAAYCREIERDSCTPMLSWIPPDVPGAIETDAYNFDPEKAREVLAASSYGGPENLPEIIWYHGTEDPWETEQALWIANQFRQVLGVELTLAPVSYDELDAMQDSPETWPQIANTSYWSGLPDPHEWMIFWTCGYPSGAGDIGYCNPEYDALVEQADRELNPEKRIRLAEESQRLLIADAPTIFGYAWDTIALVKPHVTGYSLEAANEAWPGWWTPLQVDIAPTD